MSDAEVVVVRPPQSPVTLACGGQAMITHDGERDQDAVPSGGLDETTLLGKRYADDAQGLEVLCTKSGAGTLTVDGAPMQLKGAKPLPASD